ncbi:gasdermin [Larkinella soli]|uniref:gasdermin n=1 Tax=Larkinella soli TaxID=1770527 RepID=UPI000FFBDE83|nr:hypothetical protein [Larkinella soli]
MSFRFRLCRNDTTHWLRQTFGATPLRIPEARVKPLVVVARRKDNIQFRGELKYLLDKPDWTFSLSEDPVSSASLDRTRKVDAEIGLELLQGFLKGLNAGTAPVHAALKNLKTLSFSFRNVRRRYADLNLLGQALAGVHIDMNHPSMGIFQGEDAHEMLLVSDVIVSNLIALNDESGGEAGLSAGLPEWTEYLAKAKTDLKRVSSEKSSILFEGEDYLTFAFSCVRLQADPATGAIQIREAVDVRGTGDAGPEAAPYVELDEDEFEPGLLSWDDGLEKPA